MGQKTVSSIMGNTNNKQIDQLQPLLVGPRNKTDPDIYQQIRSHCTSKPNVPSCVQVRTNRGSHGLGAPCCAGYVIATQNCHILLSIVDFFIKVTGRDEVKLAQNGATDHVLYSVRLPNGLRGCEDWNVLLIDFMNQNHPNYQLQAMSDSTLGYGQNACIFLKTVCFVPRMQMVQMQPAQPRQQVVVVMNEGGGKSAETAPPPYDPNAEQTKTPQQTYQ